MLRYFFLLFSKEDRILSRKLCKILGYRPKRLCLYKIALRYNTNTCTPKQLLSSNERLEFIGDAVINSIISDVLFKKFPIASEGSLSEIRSNIVSRKSLNNLADILNIKEIVNIKKNNYLLTKDLGGNSFEAIVGAMYYDQGYKQCKKFMKMMLDNHFDLEAIINDNINYKSQVQQIRQKYKLEIVYHTFENCEQEEKNNHFLCEICLDSQYIAEGKAWTKKEAEQNASQKAIKILTSLNYTI